MFHTCEILKFKFIILHLNVVYHYIKCNIDIMKECSESE